jgi:hypothetical protein
LSSVVQELPYRLDRPKAHLCRTTARKKAKDHLFPQPLVIAFFADSVEFGESAADLVAPFPVGLPDLFESYGFGEAFHHCQLSDFILAVCGSQKV